MKGTVKPINTKYSIGESITLPYNEEVWARDTDGRNTWAVQQLEEHNLKRRYTLYVTRRGWFGNPSPTQLQVVNTDYKK